MSLRERGWLVRGLALQSGGLSAGIALAFFLSPSPRLSAQAYWGVERTGGSITWGVVFLFAACLVVGSSWRGLRPLRAAVLVSALAYALLCVAFAAAAVRFSTANLTAPVVYGWVSYAHVFAAVFLTYKIKNRPYDSLENE